MNKWISHFIIGALIISSHCMGASGQIIKTHSHAGVTMLTSQHTDNETVDCCKGGKHELKLIVQMLREEQKVKWRSYQPGILENKTLVNDVTPPHSKKNPNQNNANKQIKTIVRLE